MTFDEFKASLSDDAPPADVGAPLVALWMEAGDDWDGAHDALQGQPDLNGSAWVHAYLHRVEGDIPNANHWDKRAQTLPSSASLPEEWEEIARALIQA